MLISRAYQTSINVAQCCISTNAIAVKRWRRSFVSSPRESIFIITNEIVVKRWEKSSVFLFVNQFTM